MTKRTDQSAHRHGCQTDKRPNRCNNNIKCRLLALFTKEIFLNQENIEYIRFKQVYTNTTIYSSTIVNMVAQNAIVAAFTATGLISLAPNVLLLLFPKFAAGEGHNSRGLSLGQALAAGGLLGDVFLHVVPHSGGSHDVGLWILLGFSVFLLTDMLMRSMGGGHNHNHKNGEKCEETKTSTILLNLTADALHNVSLQNKNNKNKSCLWKACCCCC